MSTNLDNDVKTTLESAVVALEGAVEEAAKQASRADAAAGSLQEVRAEVETLKTAAAQFEDSLKKANAEFLDHLEGLGFIDDAAQRRRIEERILQEPEAAFKLASQALDLALDLHVSGKGVGKEASGGEEDADPDGWGLVIRKGA